MLTLTDLANKHGTDKGDKHFEAHNYTPIYDAFMCDFRKEPVLFVEVGVNDPRFPCASLKMWKEYFFNTKSDIVGIDINPPKVEPELALVYQADQFNGQTLMDMSHVFYSLGYVDFVVDDGYHDFASQMNTFFALFKHVKHGGIYFIEDCHVRDCHKTIEFFKTISPAVLDIHKVETFNNKLIALTKL